MLSAAQEPDTRTETDKKATQENQKAKKSSKKDLCTKFDRFAQVPIL